MTQEPARSGLPRRLHEAFVPWANSHSSAPALSDAGRSLTYGELDGAVSATAARLAEAGLRPGDRLLLVAENSVALVVCMLAASRLDLWSATVNARLSAREIDNFIQHSGARRTLYFSANSQDARAHGEARGAIQVDWDGIGALMLGPLNEQTEPEPVEDDGARQVAALVYTSGTTGSPKAVMLTHANILFVATNTARLRRITPDDHVYGVLPLSHVYGLSSVTVASLLGGARLQLAPRFQVRELVQALADGVSVLHGAPAMYARLLEWSDANGGSVPAPRLRVAQSGGAPLTLPLKQGFEKLFGIPLQNGYGMTEASPSICQTRIDSPRSDCSVGLPIPGIEIRLHGADSDPDGIGELWVRGPNVMKGYYKSPEQTAEAITPDGWLRTGDLARLEADGAMVIAGRSKELIIRSGFNVYPVEVEQVLNAHPDVVQSAVVGRAVEDNEEVVAFVEPCEGRSIDVAALKDYLKANLSPYKMPSEIVVLERLPAAATGKVLKKELQLRAAQPKQ